MLRVNEMVDALALKEAVRDPRRTLRENPMEKKKEDYNEPSVEPLEEFVSPETGETLYR